ncbi:MAG: tail fiber domain-containing protein [Chloroflexota bacterium]
MMKKHIFPLIFMLALLVAAVTVQVSRAQAHLGASLGASFTYQGQLKDAAGGPLTATCDLRFTLWDAPVGGAQLGEESLAGETPVVDGYFTALVNTTGEFGPAAFDGGARWLALSVRCPAGAGEYTPLTPRQALTAAPYAGYALAAPWSGLAGVPAGFADGVDDTGADWHLGGNAGTDPAVHALGTTDNVTLTLVANGLPILRLVPHETSPNIIAGYSGNRVAAGVYGATIGGGGYEGYLNDAGYFGTVGGGYDNTAGNFATVGGGIVNTASGDGSVVGGERTNTISSDYATVSGGYDNTASGSNATVAGGSRNTVSGNYATVGGGYDNTASENSATVGGGTSNTASGNYAIVGGGFYNTASGNYAIVGGGYNSTASGNYAIVGGGYNNTAAGDYSFVAGRDADNANANHDGVFIFADSNSYSFASTAANQFRARATGGVQFVTGINGSGTPTTGVQVAAGGGSWSSISDRGLKANFAVVDGRAVLAAVAEMPISTWNYIAQDEAIRHIGPMAQDFYAAFGVGEDERHIATIDADGVALAAIQGLNELADEKDARIAALEARLAALERGTTAASPWPWLAWLVSILGSVAIICAAVIWLVIWLRQHPTHGEGFFVKTSEVSERLPKSSPTGCKKCA